MSREHRRYHRVRGPFDGFRVDAVDTHVRVYDLNEGGCFVNSTHDLPDPGRLIVLRVQVPDEGWIYLRGEALYTRPEFGFAVAFTDVADDTRQHLARGLSRLRATADPRA
jgi:hypothetical protein